MVKNFVMSGLVAFSSSMVITGNIYASGIQGSGVTRLFASEPVGYLIILAVGLTIVGLRRWMYRKRNLNESIYNGNPLNTGD